MPVRARALAPWAGLALLALAGSAVLFRAAVHEGWAGDLGAHVGVARLAIERGTFPGDFLYYVLVAIGAGWSTGQAALEAAAVGVLALSVAAKFLVSAALVRAELRRDRPGPESSPLLALALLTAGLLLAFSLPVDHLYLGQIPPTVWHNSIPILVMPLALGLFWSSYRWLRGGRAGDLSWTLGLGALNVAAKPSFVLVFLVVFPLAAIARFGSSARVWRALAVTVGLAILVALQYLYVYRSPDARIFDLAPGGRALDAGRSAGVVIAPLRVWGHFASSVPISLLASIAFPLAAALAYGRELLDAPLYRYALAFATVALLIYALLAESGARTFHGNFAWQAIIGLYVLFLVTGTEVLRLRRGRGWGAREGVVAAVFALHVGFGVAYLAHAAAGRAFY